MHHTEKHNRLNHGLRKCSFAISCLIAIALVCAQTFPLMANPVDGVVSAGSANITQAGSTLTVTQQTDKAIIDWRGFDIAHGETTQFVQPSSASLTLNRVGSNAPSFINGHLNANGNLVLVNPNGVIFGNGARVDVNGLIASTADISNAAFMNSTGLLNFDIEGNPDATIVNDGLITAKEAGLIGLVAPNVINRGIIYARLGRVALASGDTATVDLYGDGLIKVAVSDKVKSQLVSNSGIIEAAGGTIALTAAAGKNIVNSLITVPGELAAPSISQHNGKIIIAAEGSNRTTKQGSSTVIVSGTLDASGRNAGERGGNIQVTGDNIALLGGTRIDASGSDGASGTTFGQAVSALRTGSAGGDIRIGGDYLGQGDTPTAQNLYVDEDALILNDALNSGDAGRTIFWSDGLTQFYGNVYARALGGKPVDATTWQATAGGNTGDGGFVETSGHVKLDAGGYVDLTASNGARGTYFLDPTDITIYGNFAPNYATVIQGDASALSASLKLWVDASDTANTTLTYNNLGTTATGTSGTNTITVSANTNLVVGARIRLGGAGSVTAASTVGANTYTITNIVGTTITLASNLTANYTASGIYQGYVSQLTDKSGTSNNAVQAAAANMPLWISNGQNGLGVAKYNGSTSWLGVTTTLANTAYTNYNIFAVSSTSSTNGTIIAAVNGVSDTAGQHDRQLALVANKITNRIWNTEVIASTANYNDGLAHISESSVVSGTGQFIYEDAALVASGVKDFSNFNVVSSGLTPAGYVIGSHNLYGAFNGNIPEILIYNASLSTNARALVDQYQSAKWAIALSPPGTGGTEAAKATSATGYSVFTTRYLERLSQSANISLQATNNISLDLQGDTLNFATAGRTLTLTAGNQITTASTGNITTNNAAINLTGTNGININHAFTFNSGTATTTLTTTNAPVSSTGSVTLGSDLVINAGNANVSVAAINGTSAGTKNVTVLAGTGTFTTTAAIGAINKLNNLTVTADDVVLGGNIGGTGTLAFMQSTTDRIANVNYGTADGTNLNMNTTEVGYLVDGWSQINIGSSVNGGIINVGASTWLDPVQFNTKDGATTTNIYGAVTATGNASLSMVTGMIFSGGGLSTSGQSIRLLGNLYISAGAASIVTQGGLFEVMYQGFFSTPSNLTVQTSGGNILLCSGCAGAGNAFSLNTSGNTIALDAGSGTINFGASVNGGSDLTANAGAMVFYPGNAWGDTTALGAVSLTSTNSISLPTITASSINVQTTAVSGKLSLNGALTASATTGNGIVLNAGNEIATTVASTMSTSGSHIVLTGANGIGLYHAYTLTSSGGNITFNSPLYLGAAQTINSGTGITSFASTIDSLTPLASANVLVVAGGGGGGGGTGGGGGGGGVLNNASYALITNSSVTVTVGGGGVHGAGIGSAGTSGGNSVFGSLTAIGGGGGGANNGVNGLSGGSGGGGAWNSLGASGTVGQGNAGAAGAAAGPPNYGSGGGGGASAAGTAGTTTVGGNGGAGVSNTITGSAVTYAGGGGGGVYNGGTIGTGGTGGGGNGGSNAVSGVTGTNGLGGGGGGAGQNTGNGGDGGSGAVIVRYTGRSGQATVTGTATSTTVGSDTVWTYTGSGSFVANSVGCAGGCNLTVNAGGATFGGTVGGTTALGAVSITSINSLTLPSITASTVTVQATGATSDITIPTAKIITATGSSTPLNLVAGRNFINNAGSSALATPSGRWLVYSTNPANDTVGSLSNSFRRFSCAYGGSCPSFPGTGNGLLYTVTPTLTITPNTLSSIIYSAAAPNLSGYAYTATGYLGSDSSSDSLTGSLTGSSTYIQGSNVGAYNINYGTGTLSSTLGYGFSYANNASAFTVTPRSLSIAADVKTKVYGASDPTLTHQITSGSLYGSDAFTGTLARAAGENVGSYGIAQNTLSAGSNYTLTYVGNNLSITRAALSVTANAQSKTYGEGDPTLTYGVSGLTNGDTNSIFTGVLSRAAGETVLGGSYAINQNTLLANNNYTLSYVGNVLNISPAALKISANAQNKLYGNPDPALTYSTVGLANGDTPNIITGELARSPGSAVGVYHIIRNTIAATSNYTLSFLSAAFNILGNDIPVTVTRVSQDPTLNMAGSTNGTTAAASAPMSTSTSAQNNSNGAGNTNSSDKDNNVIDQAAVLPTNIEGAWLKISPELAAMLGASTQVHY